MTNLVQFSKVHHRDFSQPQKEISESEATITASETEMEEVITPAQKTGTPKDGGQVPPQKKSDIDEGHPTNLSTLSQSQLSVESQGFWGSLAGRGVGRLKRAMGSSGTDDEADNSTGLNAGSLVNSMLRSGTEKAKKGMDKKKSRK